MTIDDFIDALGAGSLQSQYFQILSDQRPHCRKCAQQQIGSEQLAGGGGVQGLQRGNKSRPGIVIESESRYCTVCNKCTKWDRWTGEFKEANAAAGVSTGLQRRIFDYYDYNDVIEQRRRSAHELVVDHRFPMERWGAAETRNPDNMTVDEIRRKFQLLKKDDAGNHNLLKSRACERCIATGKRGYPLGIKFYYAGNEDWPADCPDFGPEAEQGCFGCGWYDFAAWREALNRYIGDEE